MGCASHSINTQKVPVQRVQNQKALQVLKKLNQNLQNKDIFSAKNSLEYLKSHYQESNLLHRAYLLFGDFYYHQKKYLQALHFYNFILNAKAFSSSTSSAWIKAVLSAQHAHLNQQAKKLSQKAIDSTYIGEEERLYLRKLRLRLFIKEKNYPLALKEYVALFRANKQNENRKLYWSKALQMVQNQLSLKQLQLLLRDPSVGELWPSIHFRLARFQIDYRDYKLALQHLNKVTSLLPKMKQGYPDSPRVTIDPLLYKDFEGLKEAAQALEMEINFMRQVKAKSLGLILPLTGKYAARGQKVLEAVRLGLSLYGKEFSPFQLVVHDSQGQADVAERAVEEMVKKNQVIAIIGSLLSRTASVVARKAQELRVPCISLSQKMDLAKEGPFVFQHTLTSRRQVDFLIKELRKSHGVQNFALLYPKDSYGEEFTQLFWSVLEEIGGTLRGAQGYSPDQRDFRTHIKKLLGLYYRQDRLKEYQSRLEEWKAKNTSSKKKEPPEDLLSPILDFQALFIPDSVEILAQVASVLFYYNVKEVFLVGTNLWNTPDLARSLKGLKGLRVFFVDSFILDKEQWEQNAFFQLYKERVQKEPGILELNAYEVAFILKQLIVQSRISSRYGLLNKIKKMKSFPGILSPLHLSKEGEIYRPLKLFTSQPI